MTGLEVIIPLIISAASAGLSAAAKGTKGAAGAVNSQAPPVQPITSSVDPFSRLTDRRMMAVKKALE